MVDAGARKELDLEVIVPVDDMARMGDVMGVDEAPGGPAAGPEARHSIWPSIHPRLLELIRAHRSTLIFVNSPAPGRAAGDARSTSWPRRSWSAPTMAPSPASSGSRSRSS